MSKQTNRRSGEAERGLRQLYDEALTLHRERRLKEASERYEQVMLQDPPRPPSDEERMRVRKYAPRIYVTPTEYFPLNDVAVILHPERSFIAYHWFWDDDIDFPDDSDPTDHEVVWVEYDAASGDVIGVFTFYHSNILSSDAAVADAQAHGGRPAIYVQWGKHGSLPLGWEHIEGGRWWDDMRRTYQRLHTEGRRRQDHPLGRFWPARFDGDWEDFVDFSRPVEPLDLITRNDMVMVSRWGNAVIDYWFLRYNFYPKHDWPWER